MDSQQESSCEVNTSVPQRCGEIAFKSTTGSATKIPNLTVYFPPKITQQIHETASFTITHASPGFLFDVSSDPRGVQRTMIMSVIVVLRFSRVVCFFCLDSHRNSSNIV